MILYCTKPIQSHIISCHILNIFISVALNPLPINFVKIFLISELKTNYRSPVIQTHTAKFI